jgi:NAD(P)H-nitrite reductase large subunit
MANTVRTRVLVLAHPEASVEDRQAGGEAWLPALPPPGLIPSLWGMVEERTHKSLWTVSAPARRYPSMQGDLEVDVVVIGGGIAGLTTAYLLKQEGKKVAVVEMHRLLTGQTGQTTAHLTELLDTPYATLASDFGEKGARMAAESTRAAIEQIAGLVERLRISCGFQRLPAYRYAETER